MSLNQEDRIDRGIPDPLQVGNNMQDFENRLQLMKESMRNYTPPLIELCECLGWQGGTIHQIKDVLRAARMLCLIHKESQIDGDWESFKAAVYGLREKVLGAK